MLATAGINLAFENPLPKQQTTAIVLWSLLQNHASFYILPFCYDASLHSTLYCCAK